MFSSCAPIALLSGFNTPLGSKWSSAIVSAEQVLAFHKGVIMFFLIAFTFITFATEYQFFRYAKSSKDTHETTRKAYDRRLYLIS